MDIREPRVPTVVLDRVVSDVLRLRQWMSPNHHDICPDEAAAWLAASIPAFIEAEQRLHEQEVRNA